MRFYKFFHFIFCRVIHRKTIVNIDLHLFLYAAADVEYSLLGVLLYFFFFILKKKDKDNLYIYNIKIKKIFILKNKGKEIKKSLFFIK
jgi:hypothetical protein